MGSCLCIRSASVRTQVQDVVTLLGKSPKPISNAIEVSFSREMAPVSLAFKRRMQDRFPAGFRLNQQSLS
jgi:hypothetical protein